MTDKIEAGAIVTLKSGGPTMTVGCVGPDIANCCWFVGAQMQEANFFIASLKLAPEKPWANGSAKGLSY